MEVSEDGGINQSQQKPVTELEVLEMWLDVCLNEPFHKPKGYFDGYSKFVEAAAEYDENGHRSALKNVHHMIQRLKKPGGVNEIIEMFPQIQRVLKERMNGNGDGQDEEGDGS